MKKNTAQNLPDRAYPSLKYLTIPITILFTLSVGFSCYANPTDADLERVKASFLRTRFIASFDKKIKNMNDMQLFRYSCRISRVNCSPILKKLQKNEPEFYARLRQADRQFPGSDAGSNDSKNRRGRM